MSMPRSLVRRAMFSTLCGAGFLLFAAGLTGQGPGVIEGTPLLPWQKTILCKATDLLEKLSKSPILIAAEQTSVGKSSSNLNRMKILNRIKCMPPWIGSRKVEGYTNPEETTGTKPNRRWKSKTEVGEGTETILISSAMFFPDCNPTATYNMAAVLAHEGTRCDDPSDYPESPEEDSEEDKEDICDVWRNSMNAYTHQFLVTCQLIEYAEIDPKITEPDRQAKIDAIQKDLHKRKLSTAILVDLFKSLLELHCGGA